MKAPLSTTVALVTALVLLIAACSGSDTTAPAEPMAPPAATATEVPPTAVPAVEPTATAVPSTPTPEPTAVPPTAIPEPTEEPLAETVEEASGAAVTNDPDDVDDPDSDPDIDQDVVTEEAASVDPAILAAGASVFSTSCASCHGADGTGTGRGPSLVGIGQFFPEDATPLVNLVTNGGESMPEFGSKLTTEEIGAVVQYVVATFQ